MDSKWIRVGGTLMLGLFLSFLDRANLSVVLPSLSKELGYAGADFSAIVSSTVLTTFLWGYSFSNIFGGVLGQRFDPKWMAIWTIGIWSIATVLTGWVTSITMLIVLRFIIGVTEGIYWPQQSRFARAWFAPNELSRANSIIQYYGQYLALAIGFIVLNAIYDSWGWRAVFYITGGFGIVVVLPIFMTMLKKESEAPFAVPKENTKAKLSLKALGGSPFILLVFVKFAQGMLFWGITLWIPMAVKSLGFTGTSQAIGSSLPYFAAIILGVPMAFISDRTGKRILIASLGLILPGLLLIMLPMVDSGYLKLAGITIALGHASSFTPNFWSVVQSSVEPQAVGPAAGIVNGIGAGGGGTTAGFVVGLVQHFTGSYMYGFGALGVMIVLAGFALLLFEKIKSPAKVALQH